jgi:general secretion pathway protein N
MMRVRHIAIAAALMLGAEAHGANPPGALDLPPSNVLPPPVEMTPGTAGVSERPLEQRRAIDPSGNPLWAVPLSALTATRERPLFTPSRRAPAPAIAGPATAAPPPPPPVAPAEPEHPPLVLIGSIVGDTEGFAVFLDQSTNNVIRLRTGQDHDGWVLRSVKGREATLTKDRRTETLALPAPGGAPVAMPGAPIGIMPPLGGKPGEPEL